MENNSKKPSYTNADDFAVTSVPENKRKSIFNITITSCAWIISLSTIVTGGALIQGLNFAHAVLAAVLGMLILAVYGFFQGIMGAKYGISTTVLARQAFGRYGSGLFGIVLALTLGIGWFGWQVAFFGTTISEMFPGVWLAKPEVAIVWGGILMILTAFIGYRGLAALSFIAVPLVVIFSIWGIVSAVNYSGSWHNLLTFHPTGDPMTIFAGITIVVGNAALGAVVFPDVTRYAKGAVSGGIGASVGYFLGGVFCLVAGAAMAITANVPDIGSTPNIPAAMSKLGLGFLAFFIIVFAQWTTNDNNLYTGSLGLRNVVNIPKKALVAIMGVIGIMIALLGVQNMFVPFLTFLGLYVPPIAGVMIADHWITAPVIKKKQYRFGAGTTYSKLNVAAILSVIIGGFTASKVTFGIGPINSTVLAFLIYIVFTFIFTKLNLRYEIGEATEESSGF
ncbi:cytosine permease [Bacillus paralicheniformis]|uniref:cytosine permease n=1 Tax=Bacillus paralicheniformis TaxID=1648923 RepID=UPI00227EE853|nr:cytosine permease [Bacillus paralicheniformis]MCY8180669.1 cytosine permease [Bacillus paralicheniformis]